MSGKWIGIPIIVVMILSGTLMHARQKIQTIAPKNTGVRLDSISFGRHEWLRLDFQINEGSNASPVWCGGYHWSIRDNNVW